MAELAEVHTLYETNASNIPAMLRQAASNIETEAEEGYCPTRAMVAVQYSEAGGIQIYGWGAVDSLEAIAILNLGLAHLLKNQMEPE